MSGRNGNPNRREARMSMNSTANLGGDSRERRRESARESNNRNNRSTNFGVASRFLKPDDLRMDISGSSRNTRNRPSTLGGNVNNNNNNSGRSNATRPNRKSANTTTVKIEGLAGSVNERDFISFLRRQVSKPFHVKKFVYEGNTLLITVQTFGEALAISKLNRVTFNKDVISFSMAADQRVTQWPPEKQQLVVQVLASRFRADIQELDLTNLVSNLDVPFNWSNGPNVSALLKLIQQNMPQLTGLHLTSNNITSLSSLTNLHIYLPRLTKLNLSNNRLRDLKDFDSLKNLKTLQHLIISDNPLMTNLDIVAKMKTELARKFPALQTLNNEQTPNIQFGLPLDAITAPLLPPDQDNLFDSDETKTVTSNFVQRYFSMYDNSQRNDLIYVYAENACFSLVTARTTPKHGFREAPISDYIRLSRNLRMDDISHEAKEWDKRVKLIQKGPQEIIRQLLQLPSTKHPLETMRVDAWQHLESNPPLLFIFLHGDMLEPKSGGANDPKRSFDRTLVLMPTPPNSAAAQAGWPVQIVNDHLVIRSYSARFSGALENLVSSSTSAMPVIASPLPAAVSALPPVSPESIIQRFMADTRMTYSYAQQCLQENNYDYMGAMHVFMDLQQKGAIPQEAFSI